MQLKQSRCICKYVGTLSSALDASYLSGLLRGTRHCDQLYKLRISSKWPVSLLLAPQSEQLCNVVKRSSVLPCSLGEQREPSVWHFLLQAGNDFYDASTWLWDSHCECTPHPTEAICPVLTYIFIILTTANNTAITILTNNKSSASNPFSSSSWLWSSALSWSWSPPALPTQPSPFWPTIHHLLSPSSPCNKSTFYSQIYKL